jgi:putative oxidoreductase
VATADELLLARVLETGEMRMRERLRDTTLSLLRFVSGLLFLCHGAQKLFGAFGGHAVPLPTELGVAGILEFFGGSAIMLGLFTRPVAFLLAGEMAVAYWTVHARAGKIPIENHGELAILFCFIYLLLCVHGGGSLSLDARWRGRR